jgi:hypothetical protein
VPYKLAIPHSERVAEPVEAPLFLAFLSQSFRIHFVAVHLFSSPVLRTSSVAATSYPQDPNKVFVRLRSSKSRALFALSHNFVCWGSAAACVYARLLKRLSCGSVTVFEPTCLKQLLSLLLRCVRYRWIPYVFVPFSSFYAPHTKTLSARPSCQRLCFIQPKSKNFASPLCILQRSFPLPLVVLHIPLRR